MSLFLKIKGLLAWYEEQFRKTGVDIGTIMEKLPDYRRAFKYVISEIDKACLDDSLKGMDDNVENFKRLYVKAAGKLA